MKYLLMILFFSPLINFAQRAKKHDKNTKVEIQYVDIKNTNLKNILVDFINKQKTNNDLFKHGFGYITINELDFKKYKTLSLNHKSSESRSDTLISFNVSLNSYFINGNEKPNCFNCDYFPPFYSQINGCLILIYDKSFDWLISGTSRGNIFTLKSKKRLTKIIRKTLLASLDENFNFYDPFSNSYYNLNKLQRSNLSESEIMAKASFTLDNGILVYILRNGSVKIKEFK
jgi:hypothetical protein